MSFSSTKPKGAQTYNQPAKNNARLQSLAHAVTLLTSRRSDAAVVPGDYVDRMKTAFQASDDHIRIASGFACDDADIESWKKFRENAIGTRSPNELTVAYLAGPEPSNDLHALLDLGLRPENIWAFEIDAGAIAAGVKDLSAIGLRGIKFVPLSIDEYFVGTPRRFDIIYIDACAPLPSREQKTTRLIVDIFRYSALAPLGVLITNFAGPDISKDHVLDSYSGLVSSYLFSKSFLESDGQMLEGPLCYGFDPYDPEEGENSEESETVPKDVMLDPTLDEGGGDREEEFEEWASPEDKGFPKEVRNNFEKYYGAFITRHIFDIAEMIAPTIRIAETNLYKMLFDDSLKTAASRGRRFAKFNPAAFDVSEEDEGEESSAPYVDMDGEAISEMTMFSLIWTFAWLGFYEVDSNFKAPSSQISNFAKGWKNQLRGTSTGNIPVEDLIACFYAWKHDKSLWSSAMRAVGDFPFEREMPFLCDWPTEEIAFYPAFAQLAYPAHPNVRETRRFRYVAEGKKTPMFLDVVAFDECRYVYDWLSGMHLVTNDWFDLSSQLTFRFALDAIVKERRWFGDDFLYGCHVIGECKEFPASRLSPRIDLTSEASVLPEPASSGTPTTNNG